MKLTKRNKRELKGIAAFLMIVAVVFLWIVQTIGFPIQTRIQQGRIKVIDVSAYNGTIQWRKVKDQEINHAMLKIGSGMNKNRKGSMDEKFSINYRNAGYAAIRRGVYYYSYALTVEDAKKEAKHCLSLLRKQGIEPSDLDLPVAFDIEEKKVFDTGRENTTAITKTFCEEIKKAGFEPMIYSGASALKNYFSYSIIRQYKLWVAHYTKTEGPDIPFPYQMWQYSSSESVPGANTGSGRCDVNYYLVESKTAKERSTK